jgi:uncharacterized protein HemY
MRKEIGGRTEIHRMGSLRMKMGEWNKAEEIYTILSERIHDDDREELAVFHHQLGCIS